MWACPGTVATVVSGSPGPGRGPGARAVSESFERRLRALDARAAYHGHHLAVGLAGGGATAVPYGRAGARLGALEFVDEVKRLHQQARWHRNDPQLSDGTGGVRAVKGIF